MAKYLFDFFIYFMDICDRIKLIIEKEGLTIASFSRKTGIGDQTLRGIVVQKRNKPGYEVILRIAQTFAWLNIAWLITGEGEMEFKTCSQTSENEKIVDNLLIYLREKDKKIEQLIMETAVLRYQLNNLSNPKFMGGGKIDL